MEPGSRKGTGVKSHCTLLCILFAVFEATLLTSVVILWSADPRQMEGTDTSAGIAFGFSFLGLLAVSLLLRRVLPRLARFGFVSLIFGFFASMLLPAVP